MGEDKSRPTLRIGELAGRFGLSTKTLRYYEEIGLLPEPHRTADSGYRLYSEEDAERLSFVLKAKRVGFSLEEIGEVLRLSRHGRACSYVRETLSRHIAEVDRQLEQLQSVRAELLAAQAGWDAAVETGFNAPGAPESDGSFCGLIQGCVPSPKVSNVTSQEGSHMADEKRQVEVFTAGCPLCDPVVKLVQEVACSSCAVTVHDLRSNPQAAERLRAAGVERVPMVLVDGKPAECCSSSGAVTEAGLRAAGVGAG